MSDMVRAPLRVRQRLGEPASWLMRRLASRNGYGDAREFGADFGVGFEPLGRGVGIERLAVLADLPLDGIVEWSPVEIGPAAISLRGEILRYPFDWDGSARGNVARACPACVRADLRSGPGPRCHRPYVRSWWCLRDVGTCPVHRCLLETCEVPTSEGTHAPFWPPFSKMPIAGVAVPDMQADLYVLGRLGVVAASDVPVLDDLPLGEASAVLSWLGELAHGTDAIDVRSMPPLDAARIRSAGLDLALEWPGRIHRRLRRILEEAPAEARGFKGIYGRFYSRLYDDRDNRGSHGGRELLKRVFEYHATGTHPFGVGDTLFRKKPHYSLRVSVAHAAALCGVDGTTMKALAETFGLMNGVEDGGRKEGLPRDDVERIAELYGESMSSTHAADRLGITLGELAHLKESGVVKAFLDRADPLLDRYHPLDVDGIAQWIAEIPDADPDGIGGTDLRSLANDLGISLAEAIDALLDGTIRAVGKADGRNGIDAVLALGPDRTERF